MQYTVDLIIENNKNYVIKKSSNIDIDNHRSMIGEIIYYKNINHPNVPKILKIVIDDEIGFYLDKYKKLPKNIDIKNFLYQMLNTLLYLHEKGIFHSDLKPDNILIDSDGKYILIDFGLSLFYGHSYYHHPYLSTEGFRYGNLKLNDDINVDVFSLGVTVIKILSNRPKFYESSEMILREIKHFKNKIIDSMGDDGYDLICSMLGLTNGKPISAKEALNNSYFHDKPNINYDNINDDIYPYISINFEFFSKKQYFVLARWLIDVCIEGQYTLNTYLLCIHILKSIINLNINKDIKKFQLDGISCLYIASILTSQPFSFESLNYYTAYSYTNINIKLHVFKILTALDFNIKLISYFYFIPKEDKKSKIILTYMLSFGDDQKLNLKELSDKCMKDQNKWKYDPQDGSLVNLLNFAN